MKRQLSRASLIVFSILGLALIIYGTAVFVSPAVIAVGVLMFMAPSEIVLHRYHQRLRDPGQVKIERITKAWVSDEMKAARGGSLAFADTEMLEHEVAEAIGLEKPKPQTTMKKPKPTRLLSGGYIGAPLSSKHERDYLEATFRTTPVFLPPRASYDFPPQHNLHNPDDPACTCLQCWTKRLKSQGMKLDEPKE